MDNYQIIGFIVCVAVGTLVYNALNKYIKITWYNIIGLWFIGFPSLVFGFSHDNAFLFILGIIFAGIGGILGFGKMFGGKRNN